MINKMSDEEFKDFIKHKNSTYRKNMIVNGFKYWPTIDRWFPGDTLIKGIEPEVTEITLARKD